MFDLAAGDDAEPGPANALLQPFAAAAASEPAGEVSAAQILRDRPDVHAAYFREFFGAGNDRNSPAWADRVGGTAAEDYALWWYRAYGEAEGYTPGERTGLAAPAEDLGPVGRTTLDGIPLAQILADRPDVFQAFFTEYYGAGNDRNSDAWVQRVGGTTPEDYAEYWYNAHGKLEGYRPAGRPPEAQVPSAEEPPVFEAPPLGEDDSSPSDLPVDPPLYDEPAPAIEIARALIVHYTEDGGIELVPATLEQMRSLFDNGMI